MNADSGSTKESVERCKRHKWVVVPNSNFTREHHNYRQGTVRLTAMQNHKCERCGAIQARAGGSLW